MSFLETPRFPDNISYGATGGPSYKTDVVTISSGFEQRNITWAIARASYDVGHAARVSTELEALVKFFRAVKGRAHGFRFKDWQDYKVAVTEGILDAGVGTHLPTYQLYKHYAAGSLYENRKINKVVAGSYKLYKNAVLLTEGAGADNYALDSTTGIVTFVPTTKTLDATITKTITGITKASNGIVTCVGHGFATGDKIKITGVVGMTQVNDLYFTITYDTVDSFKLNVNTSTYTAYTSGGSAIKYGITQTNAVQVNCVNHGLVNGDVIELTAVGGMTQVNSLYFTVANKTTNRFELSGINGSAYSAFTTGGTISKYPQATDTLTWEGQFDVPVRFDTDTISVELLAPNVQGWSSIPLIEIRV